MYNFNFLDKTAETILNPIMLDYEDAKLLAGDERLCKIFGIDFDNYYPVAIFTDGCISVAAIIKCRHYELICCNNGEVDCIVQSEYPSTLLHTVARLSAQITSLLYM